MTKAEKTKQFIIEKTAPIFNKKGFTGTSLNDMTVATGLTKGSIYGNFGNKDEVALAAFDYNYGQISRHMIQQMHQKNTASEKLQVYLDTFAGFYTNPLLQYGCPILNTATESDDTHPELRKKAATAIEKWQIAIATLVAEGIRDGEFKPEEDVTAFAYGFIAVIEGGIMITKVTGNMAGLKSAMQVAQKMIMALQA